MRKSGNRQLISAIVFASYIKQYLYFINPKESLLLRRGISLKVICEKVKVSNCDFCNNVHDYKETNM